MLSPLLVDQEAERFCREMARREAKNFYWGFISLPHDQRVAIYAFYDFARQVDDDELGFDPHTLTPYGERPQALIVDLDHDPEPEPTRASQFEIGADQATDEELSSSVDPDAPEDTVDDDELDEDERLAQPSFHFDRA